jgi:hypothetical protein
MNVQGVKDGAAAAALVGVEQEERGGGVAPANARAVAPPATAAASRAVATTAGAPGANDAIADLVARLGGRAPVRPLQEALLQATGPARGGYAATATGRAALTASASGAKTASSTSKTTSKPRSTSTSAAAKKELAFLDDKTISVEEKLFRFLALMQQKTDQDLIAAMKSYDQKKAAAAKSASGSAASSSGARATGGDGGGGGFFGFLGDAVGTIGKSVVSGAESLA